MNAMMELGKRQNGKKIGVGLFSGATARTETAPY
jgi:hypothetical protein